MHKFLTKYKKSTQSFDSSLIFTLKRILQSDWTRVLWAVTQEEKFLPDMGFEPDNSNHTSGKIIALELLPKILWYKSFIPHYLEENQITIYVKQWDKSSFWAIFGSLWLDLWCVAWFGTHLYNLKKREKHPWRSVNFSKLAG